MGNQSLSTPAKYDEQEDYTVFTCYSCRRKLVAKRVADTDLAICPVCGSELVVPNLINNENKLDMDQAIYLLSIRIIYSGYLDDKRYSTGEDISSILNKFQRVFMEKYLRFLVPKESKTIGEMETKGFFLVHVTKHINPEIVNEMQDFLKDLTKPHLAPKK